MGKGIIWVQNSNSNKITYKTTMNSIQNRTKKKKKNQKQKQKDKIEQNNETNIIKTQLWGFETV